MPGVQSGHKKKPGRREPQPGEFSSLRLAPEGGAADL
jgi:hypothetical protein